MEAIMKYALSTLMFKPQDLVKSVEFANELGIPLEIFPLWHDKFFAQFMKEHREDLCGIVCSFHEPYNFCEHSAPRGSVRYKEAMDTCHETFEYAAYLGASHVVFHHNNCAFSPAEKSDMIKHSAENLCEMNEIAAEYKIPLLVENAGVISLQNMLFDENEFIELFTQIPNDCLIDIGHASCNGWNLERIISALGSKIKAYHAHNNDGNLDSHNRIGDGTLDIAEFKSLCEKFTPTAHIILEYVEGMDISAVECKEDISFFDL